MLSRELVPNQGQIRARSGPDPHANKLLSGQPFLIMALNCPENRFSFSHKKKEEADNFTFIIKGDYVAVQSGIIL